MATEEWVWLRHPETEGVQYVPTSALSVWQDIGWQQTEAPPEPNPALAEYVPYASRAPEPTRAKKPKSEVVEKPSTEEEMS